MSACGPVSCLHTFSRSLDYVHPTPHPPRNVLVWVQKQKKQAAHPPT